MADVGAIAKDFTQLYRDGKEREAADKHWAENVVSIEAMPGERARLEGRAAILEKHAWWNENVTVHGAAVEGPFVNGDAFAVVFRIDATMKGAGRQEMTEVALYTVKDGKIVEERFFGPEP